MADNTVICRVKILFLLEVVCDVAVILRDINQICDCLDIVLSILMPRTVLIDVKGMKLVGRSFEWFYADHEQCALG